MRVAGLGFRLYVRVSENRGAQYSTPKQEDPHHKDPKLRYPLFSETPNVRV